MRYLKWVVLGLAALAALVLLGHFAGAYVLRFTEWVDGLGVWGPVAFIAGYALATVALVPGSLLTLAAGAIFGLLRGTVYAFAGAVLGSAAAFLIARYLARSHVERRLTGDERFGKIDRAIRGQGLRVTFLLRLSPVIPFVLLNYALGLTAVCFRDYLLAAAGMLPGTLLYVYYGKVAGDVTTLSGGDVERGPAYYVLLAMGLAATVVVTIIVTRIARRALNEETENAGTSYP